MVRLQSSRASKLFRITPAPNPDYLFLKIYLSILQIDWCIIYLQRIYANVKLYILYFYIIKLYTWNMNFHFNMFGDVHWPLKPNNVVAHEDPMHILKWGMPRGGDCCGWPANFSGKTTVFTTCMEKMTTCEGWDKKKPCEQIWKQMQFVAGLNLGFGWSHGHRPSCNGGRRQGV